MRIYKTKIIIVISAFTIIAGVSGYSFIKKVDATTFKYGNYPDEKRELLERQEWEYYSAQSKNIPKVDSGGPIINNPDKPIKSEIFDFVDDPIGNRYINFTNGWRSEINNEMTGKSVIVGAGSLKDDSSQGVIMVRIHGNNREFLSSNDYLTPSKHGAVKIESFNGFNLTLVAEDGYKWIFNIPSHKFNEVK